MCVYQSRYAHAEIQHSAIFKLRAKPVVYHHVRCDEEHA